MGLITEEVEVRLCSSNIKRYELKGYNIPRREKYKKISVPKDATLLVNVKDLPYNSSIYVKVECDNCKKINEIRWQDYSKQVKEGKTYCHSCANKLYATENARITKLKKSINFEQWCFENIDLNTTHEILKRWDYELNKYKPSEISFSTNKKIWLKCNNNIHTSELKSISKFISGKFNSINCLCCSEYRIYSGEEKILQYCNDKNISFIPQKKFNKLKGIGNRLLSYDFYLPQYNLLIEYQGQFHDGTANIQTEEGFKIQQEHDKRKREYAKTNNINLLEIWYWDFDNIENILEKILSRKEED